MIAYPFIDYRGGRWSAPMVDTYNRARAEVEKRERANPPRGSLSFRELEFYRNQAHATFQTLVEIADKSEVLL